MGTTFIVVELLEIHDYQDNFPYLTLFDILGSIVIEFLQKTSDQEFFDIATGFLPSVSSSFKIYSS
jgi:hypothetical protein